MMKPSPVSEHLGRPPSRVPLCSDSGPLWGRGAGLKVEPLEHPPAPSHLCWQPWTILHLGGLCLKSMAGGWQREVEPLGGQLSWEGEKGS